MSMTTTALLNVKMQLNKVNSIDGGIEISRMKMNII